MELFFSNNENKEKAIKILQSSPSSNLLPEDALVLLLEGVKYEDLSNLCQLISEELNMSVLDAYSLTQNCVTAKDKEIVFDACIRIVNSGKDLGNNVINNTINTSSWMNHCIYGAILSSKLASLIGLDPNYAFSYGLLHDFGRKYTHDFSHVVKGFEKLASLGYDDMAKGCLTHSFINAGRCCNNEVVDTSFYIDENGKEHYDISDDLTDVLNTSLYTDYDYILNIVDLMATSRGIATPLERIDDIATRRPGIDDSPNRKYFYVSFYNLLVGYINKVYKSNKYDFINYNEVTLEEVKEQFKTISDEIYNIQNNKTDNNKRGL